MSIAPADTDIDSIGEAIAKYPSDRIKGVTLASLIRSTARSVNIRDAVGMPTGQGALTKFAEKYLQRFIRQIDRAELSAEESDVVFVKVAATAHILPAFSSGAPAFTESCWSVFVRPSSQKKLVLLTENGNLKLVISDSKEIAEVANARIIEGVTQDEFRALSSGYLKSAIAHGVPLDLVDQLQNAPTYTKFVELLKGAGGRQFINWSMYRRDRLKELFLSRMEALGLESGARQQLLSQLADSQAEAKKSAQKLGDLPNHLSAGAYRSTFEAPSLEGQARHMLKLIIDTMTLEEIRVLHIPFGRVLDALKNN